MTTFSDNLTQLIRDIINRYTVAMVEGPRGCGKSTFIRMLVDKTGFSYYKTWGSNQKSVRFKLMDDGLDLPQGTFFALDLLSQLHDREGVIADRGLLSALAYQDGKFNQSLILYYGNLMRTCRASFLVLEVPPEVILSRRIARGNDDEHSLMLRDSSSAVRVVDRDIADYDRAIGTFLEYSGIKRQRIYPLAEDLSVHLYA